MTAVSPNVQSELHQIESFSARAIRLGSDYGIELASPMIIYFVFFVCLMLTNTFTHCNRT